MSFPQSIRYLIRLRDDSRGFMRYGRKEHTIAILTLVPSIVAVLVFVYGCIGWTFRVSLSDWKGILPNFTCIGIKNYLTIFKSDRFVIDLLNNLFFSFFFIGGCVFAGMGLAILLDRPIKGEAVFRNIYIFPLAISFVVSGIAWKWLLSPNSGINMLLNTLLSRIGWESARIEWQWYISTRKIGPFHLALLSPAIAACWQFVGYIMAMYLAGLRTIPEELREAAHVDGASSWKVYRMIIIPLLRPVTLSALIILGHISLKIFDLIYVMTGSGPGYATEVPSLYMYELTFRANFYSRGAAVAVVMFAMVAVIIIPYLIICLRREVEV
jgi:glucose/mannose transport system permease protein